MAANITVRILLPVALVVAAVTGGTALLTGRVIGGRLTAEAEVGLGASADTVAQRLAGWIAMTRTSMASWSAEADILDATMPGPARQKASERLGLLKKLHTDLDAIHVVDRDGLVVASTSKESIDKLNVADRAYFQSALAGKEALSPGFTSKRTGKPVMAMAVPLRRAEQVAGVLYIVMDLSAFAQSIVGSAAFGNGGYATLFDDAGACIAHPDPGTILKAECALDRLPHGEALRTSAGTHARITVNGREELAAVRRVDGTAWLVAGMVPLEAVLATATEVRSLILITSGVSLLLIVATVIVVAATVARQVRRTAGVLEAVAAGVLADPPPANGAAELRQMNQALATALSGMRSALGAERVDWQAIGRQTATRRELIERLAAASTELSATGRQLTAAAEGASSKALAVGGAAEEVSRSVQTIATGAEEMSAAIAEISRTAGEAARSSQEAIKAAEGASHQIDLLGAASQRIDEIMKLIAGIAEQTNLLALNATIEAARAGDAGRGFSVVANEVKALAQQTASSTGDIKTRVAEIQGGVAEAIAAIRLVADRIKEVGGYQTTIAGAVEEQAATTREISSNVSEAAKGAGEIAQSIQAVAESAREATAAATNTGTASNELARMAEQLRG